MTKIRLITMASIVLLLVGAALLYLNLNQPVTLVIDGQPQTIRARALTVADALKAAGLELAPGDRLAPAASAWLFNVPAIILDRAAAVTIQISATGQQFHLQTTERLPANLLAQAGLRLFPGDRLEWNGQVLDPYQPLPEGSSLLLVFRPAVRISVQDGSQSFTIFSNAATLLQALWQAGLRLTPADRLSLPSGTPLDQPLQVEIERARAVQIQVDGGIVRAPTTAETVGQALAEANIPLQGLDYSIPAEDQPLPPDHTIRVVRVGEQISLEQKPIPFQSSYQPDPETELDQRSVVTPGEYGVQVSRVRVRYEDGVEVSRAAEAQWVAKEPVDQVLGYGTQVVVRTMDTPDGPIEYWRAVTVYITSYSPCRSGVPGRCFPGTSLGLPVQRGVVGVTAAWYSWLAGQGLYVPGYGKAIVADIGGGFPGRYWIDLGYTDADYVPWSQTTTIYFLTPVPASIPWILP